MSSSNTESSSVAKAAVYMLVGAFVGVLILLVIGGIWAMGDGHTGFYGFNPRGMHELE